MSQKRKIREDDIFDDIVSINEPSSSATVHEVVTSLSPMKKGKSCEYFDGSYQMKQQIYVLLDSVHQFDANFFSVKKKIIQLLYHTAKFSSHEKMTIWK